MPSHIIPPDAIGYPGTTANPHPVDSSTTELWRSLGVQVPPQALRQSRENHERSLHGILTAIANKLDKLAMATGQAEGDTAKQADIDKEFAKMAAKMSTMESRAVQAARASVASATAALTERADRESMQVKRLSAQSAAMMADIKDVKHLLAEEDAAEVALANNDEDFLEVAKDDDQVANLFKKVAEQADLAEANMERLLADQQTKNAELMGLKAEMQDGQRAQQVASQRAALNAADREAVMRNEMEKLRMAASEGDSRMAELAREGAEQAEAADAAAKQRMLDLQAKLDKEQAALKAAMDGGAEGATELQAHIEALNKQMLDEQAGAGAERVRIAAAAEARQLALAGEMEVQQAAMKAQMAAMESNSEAAESKSAALLRQLQEEQAVAAAADDSTKSEAQKEAEARNAAQIAALQAQLDAAAAPVPVPTSADDMGLLFAQLEEERNKLQAMQSSHAVAEGESEKALTSEMKRLQAQLDAAKADGGGGGGGGGGGEGGGGGGADPAALTEELERQRVEVAARLETERKIREAEQVGLGRIVALHHRSSTLHQIR
jgi:hypothetical protein